MTCCWVSKTRMEAERFLKAFRKRLAKFGLELHPEKPSFVRPPPCSTEQGPTITEPQSQNHNHSLPGRWPYNSAMSNSAPSFWAARPVLPLDREDLYLALQHVTLFVSDQDRSLHFFVDRPRRAPTLCRRHARTLHQRGDRVVQ
jgi:hypothetical protein